MKRILPDVRRLLELKQRGLNYQEIAAWLEEHEGVKVSRMSVASAISRAGKSNPRPRYDKHLPWKVKARHGQHYAAKMLRLLGRRDHGLSLTDEQNERLDNWLNRRLKNGRLVVVYDPRTPEGFYLIPGGRNSDGIPINAGFRFSDDWLEALNSGTPAWGGKGKRADEWLPLCDLCTTRDPRKPPI
jgi:hypothetical protein